MQVSERPRRPRSCPSRDEIAAVVRRFYARVRADDLLGPVFAPRIGDAWEPHLLRMEAFWAAVLRGEAGFQGDPVGVHRAIPGLGPDHFDRWMELFETTLREELDAATAADWLGRAGRMRVVLEGAATAGAGAAG